MSRVAASAVGVLASPVGVQSRPSNHLHLLSGESDLFRFWSDGLALAADHHEVIFAGSFIKAHGVSALHEMLERRIVDAQISVLLVDVSSPLYDPFVLLELRRAHDLTVVLLAIDDEFKFAWISSTYATVADLVLTTDHVSAGRYRQAGVNAHFFALPIELPGELPEQVPAHPTYGVTFVGRVDSGKPSRAAFARFLAQNGIDVTYFASNGPSDPAFLSHDDLYGVFRNSAINLSFTGITTYMDPFTDVLYERIRGYKIRPFEITAAGGFCISEHSASLAALLDDGIDIVFFKTKEELLERIRYFLGRPDEARRIATHGARRIAEEFSCTSVARRLADLIGDARTHSGMDLYGEPHRVKVARAFASSFIVFTLSNSIELLLRGEWRSCVSDIRSVARFLRLLSVEIGAARALRWAALAAYGLSKELAAKVRSRIRAMTVA